MPALTAGSMLARVLRRWRVALAVLTVMAGCLFVQGASAAPGPLASRQVRSGTTHSASAHVAAAATGGRYGIPAPKTYSENDLQQAYSSRLRSATGLVRRSDAVIELPAAEDLLGYIETCILVPMPAGVDAIQTCCPNSSPKGCRAQSIVHAPTTTADATGGLSWQRLIGDAWVASPAGSPVRYGTFPTAKISLLAFGSIPVTATLHLSQTRTASGMVTPLTVNWLQLYGAGSGARVTGFPVPRPKAGAIVDYDQHLTLTGKLDLRISDVRVDEQPVDVGSSCRTVTPATLSYSGARGWYSATVPIATLRGRAGAFQPLGDLSNNTGVLDATLAIPAFTGCRDGARTMNALLTALASGTGNLTSLRLTSPFFQCGNTDSPTPCPPYPHTASSDTASSDTSSSATVSSSATAAAVRSDGLSATQLRILDRVLQRLPAVTRRSAVRSMPAALRAQLPAQLQSTT